MQRRQDDIAQQLKLSLQAKTNKKERLFSLAVDKSTVINDSAQLLIFVRYLSSSFELCENFLSMETLVTRTGGQGIFIAVKNACIRSRLDLNYLRGFCTDSAPARTSNQRDLLQDSRITCPTNMTIKNSSLFTALSTRKHYVSNLLL